MQMLSAHAADVVQSGGANWTLFPECSLFSQSEQSSWRHTWKVRPFDQSGADLTWRGTVEPVQSGTFACSFYRRVKWKGSWVKLSQERKRDRKRGLRLKADCSRFSESKEWILPADMLCLSGLSVAVVLCLLLGSSEALKEGDCEGKTAAAAGG